MKNRFTSFILSISVLLLSNNIVFVDNIEAKNLEVNIVTNYAEYPKVQNGSFETGDLSDWTIIKNNTLTVTEEKKIHGTYSAKYVSDGVEGVVAYQELSTFRNTNYLVAASVSRTADTEVRIYADSINDENILAQLSRGHSNGNVYSEFKYFTTGEYDKIIIAVYDKTGTVNNDCYIDNIYITPAKQLLNQGFEDGSINGISTVGADLSYTTSEKSSGNGSLKIQTGAGQYSTLMIPIALNYSTTGNNDAIVRYRLKYKVETGSAYFTYGYNGGYTWSSMVDNSTDKKYLSLSQSSTWQELATGNNTLAYANESKQIYYLMFQVNANTTMYLDDVEVVSRYNADIDKITITGENTVGSVLTARIDSHTNAINDINLKYPYRQWQRSQDGVTWTNIGTEEGMVTTNERWGKHTTYTEYTISENDSDMYVRLSISPYHTGSQVKSDVRYYTKPVKIKKILEDMDSVANFADFPKVQNGSFETGNFDGWTVLKENALSIDTQKHINGVYGAKYVTDGADGVVAYQEVDALQNMNYLLGVAWSGNSDISIRVYGDEIADDNILADSTRGFGKDSIYDDVRCFNSRNHKKLIVAIYDITGSTGNTYYIDNIFLSIANRLANPGFEDGTISGISSRNSNISYTEEDKHTGKGSLKIETGGGSNTAFFYIPIVLNNGEQINRYKFNYKIVKGSAKYACSYKHEYQWDEKFIPNSIDKTEHSLPNDNSGDWQLLESAEGLMVKGDESAKKMFFIGIKAYPNTIIYVDDIDVYSYYTEIDKITIRGTGENGSILSAEIDYHCKGYSISDTPYMVWQKSSDGINWTDVTGESGMAAPEIPQKAYSNYSVTMEDGGQYLRLVVTPSHKTWQVKPIWNYYSKTVYIDEMPEILNIYVGKNERIKTSNDAKAYIRNVNKDELTNINVIFKEGEYRFNNGVVFDESDSGTDNCKITYRAEHGENVKFTGAMHIDNEDILKVTDTQILNKVGESAKGKLVSVNLCDIGFPYDIEAMHDIELYRALYKDMEYVSLFNNGTEQSISQWPNGEEEYKTWVEVTKVGADINGSKTNGGSFIYDGDRPERWKTNISDIWIGGHPGHNYRYERNSLKSIDIQNKEITLATRTTSGLISNESKSWKVFNVLEEIDMPGEWYIDRNTMMLYYYSPFDISETDLEISYLKDYFITLNNVKNIEISGIEFFGGRKGAIETVCVEDIDINNCKFEGLGTTAINMKGSVYANTNRVLYPLYKDAAYNCNIEKNIFYNLGGMAAFIYGGDVDSLTPGNVVFKDNYIMNAANKSKNMDAVYVYGVGNTIENNNISSLSFQAIRYRGNDNIIRNNEIYNVNKATDDVGAIYCGRSYIQRGNEISYNFIHDIAAVRNATRNMNVGIYFDDSMSGQNAHHNIIVGAPGGVYSCGQENHFENNTIVGASFFDMKFCNNYINVYTSRTDRETQEYEYIKNNEAYQKYTNINDVENRKLSDGNPLVDNQYNIIRNNLSVNSEKYEIYNKFVWSKLGYNNTVEGNAYKTDLNDLSTLFNDPENLDYRIKADAQNVPSGILNTDFDLDSIGNISNLFDAHKAAFKKYPAAFDGEKMILSWEPAMYANKYKVYISHNRDMSDADVYIVDFPFLETDLPDCKLYWNVYAMNTSREYKNEWQCVDGATLCDLGVFIFQRI